MKKTARKSFCTLLAQALSSLNRFEAGGNIGLIITFAHYVQNPPVRPSALRGVT
jgi:hypothetical protein